MRSAWKFVLGGVLIVILVLVVVIGIFAVGRVALGAHPFINGPFGPRARTPFGFMPMMGGNVVGMLLFLILGALVVLGLVALVVAGIVALFARPRGGQQVIPPPQAPPPPAPPLANKTCPNCGQAVQPDWSHCPYCGAPLA